MSRDDIATIVILTFLTILIAGLLAGAIAWAARCEQLVSITEAFHLRCECAVPAEAPR